MPTVDTLNEYLHSPLSANIAFKTWTDSVILPLCASDYINQSSPTTHTI